MDPQHVAGSGSTVLRASNDLVDKGVLGIFCVFLIIAVVHLYLTVRKEAKANAETLKALNEQHAAELRALGKEHAAEMTDAVKNFRDQMQVFFERHTSKAETWISQGHDMTARFNQAFDKFATTIEAMSRRASKRNQQP